MPPCQVVFAFEKLCIFWSFLGEKRPINSQTCRNVQTVSEFIQTRHGCLLWTHTPLVEKSRVIPHIYNKNHVRQRVFGWPEGSVCEHLIFYIRQMASIFSHHLVSPIHAIMPGCFRFRQALYFLKFSRWKKADKRPDMLQHANGARIHSNQTCMPTMGMHWVYKKTMLDTGCSGLFVNTSFFDIRQMHYFFPSPCITISCHHANQYFHKTTFWYSLHPKILVLDLSRYGCI
jgi:hypothetical protein